MRDLEKIENEICLCLLGREQRVYGLLVVCLRQDNIQRKQGHRLKAADDECVSEHEK